VTSDREDRFADLFTHYIDRLGAGERIDKEEIRRDHPDLADEILRALETFHGLGARPDPIRALKHLGDYEILRQAGRGGMGIVYEAWDTAMDRHVAVKVLPAEFLSDSKAVARFVKEAKIAGRLRHSSIVPVHAMGIDKGVPYFAMEFVEGRTLRQILEAEGAAADGVGSASTQCGIESISALLRAVESSERKASPDPESRSDLAGCLRLARAFAGVAQGLHHAHQRGVIHRDLKPSNLILDLEGRLRILDFGLARLEGQESLSKSHDVIGTLLYMSPEQAKAERTAIDHRTDVYSLGATLYEALTLHPPFRGMTPQDTLSAILQREPEPVRKLNPRVPRDLETIVLKCLAKEPRRRYATAEALAHDLERFVRGDPIEARPQGPMERAARRLWRRRALAVAAAASLLLLLTTGILVRGHFQAERAALEARYERKVLDAMMLIQSERIAPPPRMRAIEASIPSVCSASDDLLGGVALALEQEAGEARPDPLVQALASLREAKRLVPERPEAVFHEARALERLGRADEATQTLALLLEGKPPFEPARIWKAAHLEKSKKPPADLGIRGAGWEEPYLRAHQAQADARWEDAIEAYARLLKWLQAHGDPYLGAIVEATLARGTARFKAGKLDEAIEDFAAAATLEPKSLEPALLLARTHYKKGNTEVAKRRLQDLYDATALKEETARAIATVHRDFKENELALEWLSKLPETSTREAERTYSLVNLKRLEDARKSAARAIELDPADYLARHALGVLLLEVKKYEEAADAFRKAVELNPENVECYLSLGESLNRPTSYSGNPESAQAAFERAQEVDPQNETAALSIAGALYHRGKFDEARHALERILEHDSGSTWARNGIGLILAGEGKFDEALQEFEKASEISPEISGIRSNVGWMLLHKGKLDEAEAACRKAIEMDPSNDKALVVLGSCLVKAEKLDEALQVDERVAESNPRNGVGHFNRGVIFEKLQRWDDAEAAYRKAISANPNDLRWFYNLANLLRSQGKFNEAIAFYEKALQLDPDHEPTHNNVGLALYQAGRLGEAAKHFARSFELAPESPDAYFNLATIFEAQGKLDEAIAWMKKGLPHAPVDPRPRGTLSEWLERKGDVEGSLAAVTEALTLIEDLRKAKPTHRGIRTDYLSSLDRVARLAARAGQSDRAREICSKALALHEEGAKKDDAGPQDLNDYAWALLTCEPEELRDAKAALEYSKRAVRLTDLKDPGVLDTLGLALFSIGEARKAVVVEKKAISLLPPLAPGDPEPPARAELTARLRQFEKAVASAEPSK
jgi:tetratricopeptide (TPR) repeat protein/tRNA A-37 threonylcarbamoyl transferase component Bud32